MAKELLFSLNKKDFIVEPFRGSGNGGQHRNKTMSCCRIKHPASGAVAEGKEERSFEQNKKNAFKRLVEKPEFQKWFKFMCAKALGMVISAEQWVEEQIQEHKLKVEIKVDGKWTEVKMSHFDINLEWDDLKD
jgi:hypothetical protein